MDLGLLFWPACWIAAYLTGAIPFGLLLGLTRGVDIREHGSGNIGATNLLRVCGKAIGLTGFCLDLAKGLTPVLIAGALSGLLTENAATAAQNAAWLAVGAAAMLGHLFPLYLRFKGGKGVATGLGMLLGFFPWTTAPALAALAVWIATVTLPRYVSVASMTAAAALPVAVTAQLALFEHPRHAFAHGWPFPVGSVLLAALVIVKHRTNIRRLRDGTESKIQPKPPATPTGSIGEPPPSP